MKVNWNTTKTDIPVFDASILDPKNKRRGYNCKLRWISPNTFLEYQYKIMESGFYSGFSETGKSRFWIGVDKSSIVFIKKQIKQGKIFYPFVIEFDEKGNLLDFQEGRHRIIAMKELGVKRVPVYFCKVRRI